MGACILDEDTITGVRACWCVTDFEEFFVLIRAGKMYPSGETWSNDYVVNTRSFEQSQELWESFNEWQFSDCPFKLEEA